MTSPTDPPPLAVSFLPGRAEAPPGTGAEKLRALLRGLDTVPVHGVWDPVTAALAAQAGHRVVHLSGAVTSALELGLPDLGYVHGTHLAARAAALMPSLRGIPLLADADTGYGNALQAVWTAQRYARAGIAGLHIEDQVQPKRCGHLGGKELVETDVAAAKVRAVAEAATGIVVIARTDAYSVAGLDETLRRADAYLAAGADAVFPEGVTDPAQLARFDGMPLVVNLSEAAGSRAHQATDDELGAAGVRLVLRPTTAFLAAVHAVQAVYSGRAEEVPTMKWSEFTGLIGQEEALALDARYAL
ncbi:carboxyvinyl-carboxyphosphonate phosphorylmutase [Rhizocola hellebori]|uniref:Carboxyvinyl-carboxyphosphonate phosphorylmutase n=1 Tax=Rhizocola hellebori TaxID=1392758 RepID=A0A8J3Q231_9ACTN|nr:isocitrate lyase/PEP mutase family protein [Rhizocola hellebori]GIH02403.1 carboxyvinyl-carboxyphosphonate phosphorylmutase [Rhizocola hellebori]